MITLQILTANIKHDAQVAGMDGPAYLKVSAPLPSLSPLSHSC